MTTPILLDDLKRDEGVPGTRAPLLRAMPDPLSHGMPWTIGWGHTGPDVHEDSTCTMTRAETVLCGDLATVIVRLDKLIPWWTELSPVRQDALANMAFNIGPQGVMGFPRLLAALQRSAWADAAAEITTSLWARQVGERAQRVADMIRTGSRLTVVA